MLFYFITSLIYLTQRHYIALDAPLDTLPAFANDEEWYEAVSSTSTLHLIN